MTDTVYQNIIQYGQFYYPAHKHYQKRVSVVCDRCRANNLTVCIGFKEYDLCMKCVEKCSNLMQNAVAPKLEPMTMMMTLMEQEQFKPESKLTFMQQQQFAPKTRMVQQQFAPTTRKVRTNMEQMQFRTKMRQSQYK